MAPGDSDEQDDPDNSVHPDDPVHPVQPVGPALRNNCELSYTLIVRATVAVRRLAGILITTLEVIEP